MPVTTLKVGLHPSLAPSAPEVKYVLRTLLRLAGYAYEFHWAEPSQTAARQEAGGQAMDLYYGPDAGQARARVCIASCGRDFAEVAADEPRALREQDGLAFFGFGEEQPEGLSTQDGRLHIGCDIVAGSYWLLSGAREICYARDRWDNLDLSGSFLLRAGLLEKPAVSFYAAYLQKFFEQQGRLAADCPWAKPGSAAFAFSHDVDYPQIIRWIECLRLAKARGTKALGSVVGILRGTNHFWKFADWVEFEKRLNARSAFYFSARKGSLWQYATGTPDCFYDIHAPEFRKLFRYLADEGCEIGLHASYHAHRSAEQLARERKALEDAAGVPVEGNRHHYWHLDPSAPHETLRRHEQAGLRYDSSLAFEFHPGYRRGICHPFRVFHPGERRELKTVELPPAWMDDHFDRRLAVNKIADPVACAKRLVDAARATRGIVVVDYHDRGMNSDFFPRYGPWLVDFVGKHLDSSVTFRTPRDIAHEYLAYESTLENASRDLAQETAPPAAVGAHLRVRPLPEEAGRGITVDFFKPEEATAWEAFVESHPQGNIYHTLAWKAVTEEGFGHRAYYLRALDSEGNVCGVLPLFLVKGLYGRRLVSVPMRDRGGVLARDAATASLLVGRAIELMRELGCSYLEMRSLGGLDDEIVRAHGLECSRNWITTRVDLRPGADKLWKALDRDAIRWAIQKSRREGVTIERAESSQDAELFWRLFAKTRHAMGIPVFPLRLFTAIWRHLIVPGKAILMFVRKDGQPIHGMISFFSKDTFIPAYAAPQNAWRKLYPNEFMFWHTMEWAAQNGFRWYDFGADSPRQAGLLFFKRKWGGVPHAMHYHFARNGAAALPEFDSSSWTYALARRAWRMLPALLSRPLGAWVTRQLS